MGGEGASHKHSRGQSGSAHLEHLVSQDSRRVCRSRELQCCSGGFFEELVGHCFSGDVQSGTGDFGFYRTALGDLVHEIHSGEKRTF